MKKVNSFEEACEITGANPNIQFPDGMSKASIACHKLEIIHKATNGDWVPDFNNPRQYKYLPWLEFNASRGAFVCTHTGCTLTDTYLGARFYFADRDTARQFAEQHIDLINELHGKA